MSGYIAIQRRLFDHPFWREKRQFSRAEAWIDLIQSAAWNDHIVIVNGAMIAVKRGEMVASLRFLGERWGWGKTKVSTFVRFLTDETMLRQEVRQGQTVLILCNYETYNGGNSNEADSDQQEKRTATRQAQDSSETKRNKLIKENNKTIENKNKNKGTLEEVKAFVVELGLPESDGEATFHKWEGNGWTVGKATIKDWKATIRSWKTSGYMPSQRNGLSPSQPQSTRARNQDVNGEYLQLPASIEY